MSYGSLADIKARLSLSVPISPADDATLQVALDWATSFIDRYTSRTFAASPSATPHYYTHANLAFNDYRLLMLDYDCLAVSSLVNGDGNVITSDKYVLEPRNAPIEGYPYYAIRILSSLGQNWVWPVDSYVQVLGTWGYSLTPDAEIVGDCLRLAEWFYRSKAPLTTTTLFDGTVQKETPEGFPTEVLVSLGQRRRLGG